MKLKTSLVAIMLATGIAASPAIAKVNIVQVPSAALAPGATYAFPPVAGIAYGAPAPAVVNQITAERLANATQSVMSTKGYRLVQDPAEADLIVTYQMITATELDGKVTAHGGFCEPLCSPRDYSVSASEKTRGTLVLDFYERRTGRLVYRATSEKKISDSDTSPEQMTSLLKKMTKSMPSA